MKIDKKIQQMMLYFIGGLIIFIIFIALISSCTSNKKHNLEDLEKKLITIAKDYYKNNEEELPKEGKHKTLSTSSFVSDGKIKHLELKNGESCSGEIKVINNNNNYLYIPILSCGSETETITLNAKITNNSNIVTSGNGLYNNSNSYIYRGENLNNYLSFADKIWQIVKVNADGTIRVIDTTRRETHTWDDRYNIDRNISSGINEYVTNDINSRIKDRLNEIYLDEEEFTEDQRAYFVKHDLCIGKRSETETNNNGDIECSNTLPNQVFGLIQANEFLLASLDENCTDTLNTSCINYNYFSDYISLWTITADNTTSYYVYKIQNTITKSMASGMGGVQAIAHLDSNVIYNSGDGSIENPYTIK